MCFGSILRFLWGEILRGLWSFNLVCLLVERWIDSAVSGLGRQTCWVQRADFIFCFFPLEIGSCELEAVVECGEDGIRGEDTDC